MVFWLRGAGAVVVHSAGCGVFVDPEPPVCVLGDTCLSATTPIARGLLESLMVMSPVATDAYSVTDLATWFGSAFRACRGTQVAHQVGLHRPY